MTVHRHPSVGDQLRRVVARPGEPPADQLGIEPEPSDRHGVTLRRVSSPAPESARRSCSWASSNDRDVLVDRSRLEGVERAQYLVDRRVPGRRGGLGPLVVGTVRCFRGSSGPGQSPGQLLGHRRCPCRRPARRSRPVRYVVLASLAHGAHATGVPRRLPGRPGCRSRRDGPTAPWQPPATSRAGRRAGDGQATGVDPRSPAAELGRMPGRLSPDDRRRRGRREAAEVGAEVGRSRGRGQRGEVAESW